MDVPGALVLALEAVQCIAGAFRANLPRSCPNMMVLAMAASQMVGVGDGMGMEGCSCGSRSQVMLSAVW